MSDFLLRCVLAFVLAALSDFCFTLYIRRAGEGSAVAAGMWSAAIAAFGAMNVVGYVADHWLLVPVVCGYYAGTWVAVKHDHPTQEQNDA